jgi:hypothetical protein
MKKTLFFMAIIAALFMLFTSHPAWAVDDVRIQTTADAVVVAQTKLGADYVRIIITEQKTLGGIAYTSSLPVMVFEDDLVTRARTLKAGDKFEAIVAPREFQSKNSYIMLSLISPEAPPAQ